jgi:hypothetical protein
MAASKSQGSYLVLFWTAITVLCAGLAYLTEGFGKLVLIIGLAGVAISLFGFYKVKPEEGATATPEGNAVLKVLGIVITWGGWFVTVAGLHITTSVPGRLVFALAGIAISLIGIIGVLTVAFGKKVAGKLQTSGFAAKTSMEHSR